MEGSIYSDDIQSILSGFSTWHSAFEEAQRRLEELNVIEGKRLELKKLGIQQHRPGDTGYLTGEVYHFGDNGDRKIPVSELIQILRVWDLDIEPEVVESIMTDKFDDRFIELKELCVLGFRDFFSYLYGWNVNKRNEKELSYLFHHYQCHLITGKQLHAALKMLGEYYSVTKKNYSSVDTLSLSYDSFGVPAPNLRLILRARELDMTPEEVETIVSMINKDGNGFIDLKEFCGLGFRDFFSYLYGWKVNNRNEEELSNLFNSYKYRNITGSQLHEGLKILEQYYSEMGRHVDVATDPSLSQRVSLEVSGETCFDTGNLSTSGGDHTTLNAYDLETGKMKQSPPGEVSQAVHVGIGFINIDEDSTASTEQSSPDEDPPEVGADIEHTKKLGETLTSLGENYCSTTGSSSQAINYVDVAADATASMEQLPPGEDPQDQEVRVDIGRANSNGERTADQLDEYWSNEARMVRRVSVAVGGATSSNVVKAACATSYIFGEAATWLRGTAGEAATPNVVKIAKVACALGVLADMGKELPIEYIGATILAILIPIAVMVFAHRQA